MPDQDPAAKDTSTKKADIKSTLLSWLPYVLIPLVVYFGNVEVQSYLGRQALEETGLAHIPLNEALAKAGAENKLVLADMSAIWCPSCRKLDQQVLANDAVKQAIAKDYVFSRIEYESDEGEAFMVKYQVRGFPTLLILDAEGNKLTQLPLTFSPAAFIDMISRS